MEQNQDNSNQQNSQPPNENNSSNNDIPDNIQNLLLGVFERVSQQMRLSESNQENNLNENEAESSQQSASNLEENPENVENENDEDDNDEEWTDEEEQLEIPKEQQNQNPVPQVLGTEPKVYGCAHYKRKCEILSPCCKQYFPCRLCHDKAVLNGSPKCNGCKVETMDRFAIFQIRCLICGAEQKPQSNCEKCGVLFASYFCPICKIWVDDKDVYHCEKCGICRMGTKDNHKHCDICNMDFSLEYFPTHPCKPNQFDGNCPICLQKFFDSRKNISFLNCGHLVHQACLRKMLSAGITNCPCCQKSLAEYKTDAILKLIEQNPMPKEYEKDVKILCNDCCKFATVPLNWIAMRCPNCQSWNTKLA